MGGLKMKNERILGGVPPTRSLTICVFFGSTVENSKDYNRGSEHENDRRRFDP